MEYKLKQKPLKEIYEGLGVEDKGKVQKFLDKTVSESLQPYVSFKSGTQEKSIKIATVLGSGIVRINVPYAEYQAYSRKIKKRVGKRGTRPWERMVADEKEKILKQVADYGRSIADGG